MDKLIKPFAFLMIIILFCSVLVRVLSGSQTLEEYAQKNPEIAYATPQITPSPVPVQTASPKVLPSATASPNLMDTPMESPTKSDEISEITYYQEGFFYHPLTDSIKAKITGISYPIAESVAPALSIEAVNIVTDTYTPAISYDDLCYMNVLYYDFNGAVQTGELICHKQLAQDFAEIFYELYLNEYQIEKIRLIDEYNGDDTASMEDNNTSCFNYRVVDGTDSLSKHALGCAIDINPFYNPYVVFSKEGGEPYISPAGSEVYADRSKDFPYKIDENDLCYKLFKEHGFTWGGNWNSCKDYQHFQKVVN